MAMPIGAWNRAVLPAPSVPPLLPHPASVVTAPFNTSTRRTLSLPQSATKSARPSGLRARPYGYWNRAASPTPSMLPWPTPPASVVTAPLATSTRRILALPVSATKSVPPSGLRARYVGPLKCAATPTPLALPLEPLPARVVSAPVAASTFRIACPRQSATKSVLPSGLTAMPSNLPPSGQVATLRTLSEWRLGSYIRSSGSSPPAER
mmetsp:Transcript_5203/g.15363  ORF Transcript_5203/g.15363 Transcript_5203/m.15363 type:complete len:208 (-) Transcript_5203:186-809(-)